MFSSHGITVGKLQVKDAGALVIGNTDDDGPYQVRNQDCGLSGLTPFSFCEKRKYGTNAIAKNAIKERAVFIEKGFVE